MDPSKIPSFSKVTAEELAKMEMEYNEMIVVIHFFIKKFLEKSKGIPLLVSVTDQNGVFIESIGDKSMKDTMVHHAGLQKGIQFTEEKAGVSSVLAAIELNRPIQLLGSDHYHHFLHSAACYSVPLSVNNKLKGTISVMTFLNYAHPMILTSLETVVDSIQRELDLREQNRYLDQINQMMLEKSTIGYIVIEKNGHIITANPKAKSLMPALEKKGQFIHDIKEFHDIQEFIEQGNSLNDYEMVLRNPQTSICLVDCFPFLEGSLIQLYDISEYKKTESYIQDAEKLSILGQLAAGVAHEIKNPLTTLKGFIQLIQENQYDESFTPVLLKEIERINHITNEFLNLSRPTVNAKDWYVMSKLFTELEVILSSLALPKNIDFVLNLEDVPAMYCDGNQLKQVFINLFKNSVEAVEQNGVISISVQLASAQSIRIRFEDNGEGFPNEILTKAGQPFVTTKQGGNGLGS
ncbi:sensor histidine kinase [Halalkalibacter wakoensis JCM 9140]|uniref:histidine kinase n=1 Tax=Halalkalibacter wakoensis JCM 9140 TaxID=1236970 RepID=W4Q0W5_9BACI|nr:histidine kinase dimerization/phospho-acceptor domain-containing protein [Halalkalibacter wakoensis]GAE25580.1 sensor histidine kinase [Halalkalibacter wakoensis JCM 9140]